MSDTIVAAIIGGFCSIIVALITRQSSKKNKPKNNRQQIIIVGVIALIFGFALGRLGINFYRNIHTKIVHPAGTKVMQQAVKYEVDNYTQIKWKPSNLVMTVQTYRNDKKVKDYKNVQSGDSIVLCTIDTGATEIKIWDEEKGKQIDQIWVWTKNWKPLYCKKKDCPGHNDSIDKCPYYCEIEDCPGHSDSTDKCIYID